MESLRPYVGKEHALDDVNHALAAAIRRWRPAVVGALHVTCADESEWECADSFQRICVTDLLPPLKFAERSAFRLSNLGGRYEWGALPVAEHHFATPETRDAFKVLLVKVNAHVAVQGNGPASRFGRMTRYDHESPACGALHALLSGAEDRPFLRELRAAFGEDELDRLAVLRDEGRVEPRFRALFAALVNARLQARRVEAEAARHSPLTPTRYVVAACVTLNRPQRDTEFFCGVSIIDRGLPEAGSSRHGLGDDPRRYRVRFEQGRLHIEQAD